VKDLDEVEGCRLRRRLRKELGVQIKGLERQMQNEKPDESRTDDDLLGLATDMETLKTTRTRLQKVRSDFGRKGMGYLYAMSDYQRVCDKRKANSGRIQDYFMINLHRYYDLIEKEGRAPHEAIEMMNKEIMG